MTPISIPPTSLPPEPPSSPLLRIGTGVGLAAAAALSCTLPAALRIAPTMSTGELARVWVALAAAALGPMVASVFVLRQARGALRPYAAPLAQLRLLGLGLWLSSLFVAFALIGSVLRATTHQHALAGVTFAFAALAVAIGSGLFCARLVAVLAACSPLPRGALAAASVLAAALAVAWVGVQFVRAVARDPGSANAAATVVDILAFTLSAVFAAQPSLSTTRTLAVVGPPLAGLVLVFGTGLLGSPPIRAAIQARAPVFAPATNLIPASGAAHAVIPANSVP